MPVSEVELEFGDGTYRFRLGLKQIAELQEKCGAGIGAIYKRALQGDYKIEDCVETIRLGLVGGGLDAVAARRLVDHYTGLPTFTVKSAWDHTVSILIACIQGYEPPVDKKKEPAPLKKTRKSAST